MTETLVTAVLPLVPVLIALVAAAYIIMELSK